MYPKKEMNFITKISAIRVFPKIDYSANVVRIVLAEYTIGSVVALNFCYRFAKNLTNISQGFGKIIWYVGSPTFWNICRSFFFIFFYRCQL